ncbi:hypothetical protein NKR23_g10336 [Pleurostoma richardsiae]|uniref:Mitochondrial distribution and morphology protein 31 n=1 Tax=Pleurostoma richardsiae TaxID=41990 RepID=A0AA38R5C8_9PEZI|nr:hypothetical protein NKR23_g10336 [Pleurostoma richardsiae]
MSASTTTAHLGRHLWSSLGYPAAAEVLGWNLPLPLRISSLNISRAGQAYSRPILSRFFHVSRPFSRNPKLSAHNVKRSCTSGGLLLLSLSSPSSSETVAAGCAAAAESALSTGTTRSGNIGHLAREAWQRSVHTSARGRVRFSGRRRKSTNAEDSAKTAKSQAQPRQTAPTEAPKPTQDAKPKPADGHPESITDSMSKYLHLPNLSHLPKMPHRPTKEELLAAANGFFERLKVRLKWFSIRSMRPWNADEWGAFVSWVMLGHLVWILVGTTTFFSLIIFMVNTVFAQETLAKWIGDYLTQSAGVTVVFESAIVPKWKDGVITFRNVFVSRRPGQIKSTVTKGSSSTAAAAAAARHGVVADAQDAIEDDGNYTQFDLTISAVDVTLSFLKWWNSKGLLKDVDVKGVRGVVDRTSVRWPEEQLDPLSYRHEHQPGDFEIERFKLEDLLVTVHQPEGFRPFSVSIYSCELPQLRKQWLFYDFLSASHMSGSFDGSLFTIHPRQIHGVAAGDDHAVADSLGEPNAWKKFSRLRIDGLKIDHLNRGVQGPFGWIYEGNVDIVADIMFPAEPDESIGKVVSDFYDKMEEAVTSNRYLRILDNKAPDNRIDNTFLAGADSQQGHLTLEPDSATSRHADSASVEENPSIASSESADLALTSTSPPNAGSTTNTSVNAEPPRYLVMDLRIHLNDVRAAVPLFHPTPDMSYVNQTLIRPIVAYINAKRTYIPITCRIVKRNSDFDGSWTVFDCGLMDDMSAEVYAAFARDVEDQQSRVRRLKKVGFWAISVAVQALLVGVAGDLMT